jgi:hypothetical protein
MKQRTDQTRQELSDPKERAHLLERVRGALWTHAEHFGLSRRVLEKLDAELQQPAMFLYERGLLEIVTPAIGTDKTTTLKWEDLSVAIVHEQGDADLSAGKVVWSVSAA